MAKFLYPMQNILNIKYKLEEQEKTNYGLARNKLSQEEEKLEKLEDRKLAYESMLRRQMQKRLNILEIKRLEDAIELIKISITYQIIVIRNAEHALELARIKLNEAIVDRKIHEKLREHALEIFLKEEDVKERKEIDELVSFKYNNRSKSEDEL